MKPPSKLLGVFCADICAISCIITIIPPNFSLAAPINNIKKSEIARHNSKDIKNNKVNNQTHTKNAAPIVKAKTKISPPPYQKLSLHERLTLIEDQLHTAKNNKETLELWEHAENLRFHSLNAASRLLIDESDSDLQSSHISEAVQAINAAIAIQPTNALLHRKRAALRLIGNDPMGAIDDLAFTLHDDPRDPTAWLLLTRLENIIHNDQIALSTFQKLVDNVPNMPQKNDMLKTLKKKAYGQED